MKTDDIFKRKETQPQQHSFTEKVAAEYIGMSISFLRQSRSNGDRINRTPGPDYMKIGRSVRYLKMDLDTWLEKHRCSPAGCFDVSE